MTENRAAQRAMEKIMKGEVKKRSRARFVAVNVLLWFFGALSVGAGALIVSIIIFTIANSDADLHHEIYGCAFPRMTFVAIGLWVLLTGLFVILCDMSVRNTNRGYVYPLWLIVLSNVFLSLIFGVVFYKIGVSYDLDHMLGMHMRYYYDLDKRRAMLFNMPDKGIVMGQIIAHEPTYVVMLTPEQKLLAVTTDNLDEEKRAYLRENEQAVFLGKINEDGVFVACDMRTRQMSGVRQAIKDKLHIEVAEEEIEEQKKYFFERVRITTYQMPRICNEQMQWRIVGE